MWHSVHKGVNSNMPIRTFNKIKLQLVLSAKNANYSLFTFKSPMENLLFGATIWMINRNFTEDLVAIREVLWLMMIERRVKLFNLHGYCPRSRDWSGGVLPYISHIGMCRPIGCGLCAFWSENGYTLCPFWSRIVYGFRGNYGVYERIASFQFQISE